MDKTYQNISRIEDFFYTLLYKNVSENVFAGNLPISIKTEWEDIVVIDAGSAIRDMNAYGYGTVLILVYTKPLDNGIKDVVLMDDLESKLLVSVETSVHPHYVIRRGAVYADYDAGRNLHCNIYEINLTIV